MLLVFRSPVCSFWAYAAVRHSKETSRTRRIASYSFCIMMPPRVNNPSTAVKAKASMRHIRRSRVFNLSSTIRRNTLHSRSCASSCAWVDILFLFGLADINGKQVDYAVNLGDDAVIFRGRRDCGDYRASRDNCCRIADKNFHVQTLFPPLFWLFSNVTRSCSVVDQKRSSMSDVSNFISGISRHTCA